MSINAVASLAGAWIEIIVPCNSNIKHGSLHSRERGLKYRCCSSWYCIVKVASLAGAWIEMPFVGKPVFVSYCRFTRGSVDWNCWYLFNMVIDYNVASLAGAWIEIFANWVQCSPNDVASLAGAWIEILKVWEKPQKLQSRFTRGSVDWNDRI